jgi:carbonic anhydrase
MFDDIYEANSEYVKDFSSKALTGRAARGLAIVTCMDSRIDPLGVTGMSPGDAKILRNAGARVTDDVLRTLILATHLLGVNRVLVMPHTDCRMASGNEASFHKAILDASGVDTRSIEIRTVENQVDALKQDVLRIETYPLLAKGVTVAGAIYDVKTGKLEKIL